jgi:hypothetical protein
MTGRDPHPNTRGNRDHRCSRRSRTRASAATSTPLSTMMRRSRDTTISIRVDDETAGAPARPSAKTTAGTNPDPASPPVWGCTRNCRRHVVSNDREMPYRRAVDETRREPLRLSATIRSFSSSVQCRHRPVSTTSRRSNKGLDVGTATRSVLYPHGIAYKAALAEGVRTLGLSAAYRKRALPNIEPNMVAIAG